MFTPIPRLVSGSNHTSLISRVLGLDAPPETERIDLVTTSSVRISLLDTGTRPGLQFASGSTYLHVLWQLDEADAWLEIEGDRFPFAPGDSASIPNGDAWQVSQNQLLLEVALRDARLALPIHPSHGVETFHQFNRETIYPSARGVRFSRWKLTGAALLPASSRESVIVSLYSTVAIHAGNEIRMLGQGTCVVVRKGGQPIRIVPNGLAYVMTIELYPGLNP